MVTGGIGAYRREVRRSHLRLLAAEQAGVLSRRQLLAHGITRWEIEAELRAGRWTALGAQSIRVAPGDMRSAAWWRAILEVADSAALDGISALVAAGLTGVDEDAIHVAVPKSADPRRCRGVVVHETRRYERESVLGDDIPRTKPATAAVHAALWARTDRQAALYVIASAQQRLFTPEEFALEAAKVRRDRRRRFLHTLHLDIVGGIEALGEQDFDRHCRRRRFPQPTRQRWRQLPSGGVRLDTDFDPYRLTVEIDGIQHLDLRAWMGDALKQNLVTLEGQRVLRIPSLAFRLDPEPFLDQVEVGLRAGGWRGPGRR